jgi:hypothetical protein
MGWDGAGGGGNCSCVFGSGAIALSLPTTLSGWNIVASGTGIDRRAASSYCDFPLSSFLS